MKRKVLPHIVSAEPVIPGVLKIVWNDKYAGLVDLRPVIARGQIFSYLAKPANFAKVRVAEFGHAIEWLNDRGEQIDFAADTLREKAEKQAALIALAS
jgi:hypothetical protein